MGGTRLVPGLKPNSVRRLDGEMLAHQFTIGALEDLFRIDEHAVEELSGLKGVSAKPILSKGVNGRDLSAVKGMQGLLHPAHLLASYLPIVLLLTAHPRLAGSRVHEL